MALILLNEQAIAQRGASARRRPIVPQRVKDRVEVVRLSHQQMYVEKIAAFFDWNERTVRETLQRWQA